MYDLNEDNFKPNHLLHAHMEYVGEGTGHHKRGSGWGWACIGLVVFAVLFFGARMMIS